MDKATSLIPPDTAPLTTSLIFSKPTALASTWKHDIVLMDHATDPFLKCGDDHSSPASSNRKEVVSETNFFALNGNFPKETSMADHIKKETTSAVDVVAQGNELDTGLNLLMGKKGSEKSIFGYGAVQNKKDYEPSNELASLQAEIDRMNVENQYLRGKLNQANSNYYALQMHLVALMQQHQYQKVASGIKNEETTNGALVARQFMDPGKADVAEIGDDHTSLMTSEDRSQDCSICPNNIIESMDYKSPRSNTSTGCDLKSCANRGDAASRYSRDYEGADQAFHEWTPNKIPKFNSSKDALDEPKAEAATSSMIRKARVSVRARSEASMISDGCQWRKYGQKMAKGNPCPRAYYRCTMATACPVRKQVQRCAEDQTILVTTYEGHHNHPLPPAAMAMASTTSAAASSLLSGSMPSADGFMNTSLLANTLVPCPPGFATLSASAPFPTVTLDLTQNAMSNSSQRTQGQFIVPSPSFPHNFAAAQHMFVPQLSPNTMQMPPSQDTVCAATAAITQDPSFTAALAAAITSLIGSSKQ